MTFPVGMRVTFKLPKGHHPKDWLAQDGWEGTVVEYLKYPPEILSL